jgi:hypothetical protein
MPNDFSNDGAIAIAPASPSTKRTGESVSTLAGFLESKRVKRSTISNAVALQRQEK